ncbi:prepilin peptidase [Candidimonas sp. SYP-B2681]|uniref:A24 family peptidase n=1 Tax=Candidimonas sp. SYP-B2681 TaxID=2497686 RepID=UPI0013154F71|nr:prepilin peptidase [Candidimonas sp. SYP-B2681]
MTLVLILAAALALLLALASQDLRHRRLPNPWVGAYALIFPFCAWALGLGWTQTGWHVLAALAALLVTSAFFALRWMGGGDVKLWSALMLWAGPPLGLQAVLIATMAGGLLGILSWFAQWRLRRLPRPLFRRLWRLLTAERGVPYGVGLALAGMYVLYVYVLTTLRLH